MTYSLHLRLPYCSYCRLCMSGSLLLSLVVLINYTSKFLVNKYVVCVDKFGGCNRCLVSDCHQIKIIMSKELEESKQKESMSKLKNS